MERARLEVERLRKPNLDAMYQDPLKKLYEKKSAAYDDNALQVGGIE